MKKLSKWFTLIEILITMTIIMLISTISFSNYIYRSQLDSIRYWSKQITQLLTLARNQSIYWYYWTTDWNTTNKNIAIYFKKDKNTVRKRIAFWQYFLWENLRILLWRNLILPHAFIVFVPVLLWSEPGKVLECLDEVTLWRKCKIICDIYNWFVWVSQQMSCFFYLLFTDIIADRDS